MKLVYQGPETDTPGDLRVYEKNDGSIVEVRSARRSFEMFASGPAYDENPAMWEQIARDSVTRQIEGFGEQPYGNHELHVTDDDETFSIVNTKMNRTIVAAVRIEARQKYWPAAPEED